LKKTFTVTIKNKETGKVYQEHVNSDDYILKNLKRKVSSLHFHVEMVAVQVVQLKLNLVPYSNLKPWVYRSFKRQRLCTSLCR